MPDAPPQVAANGSGSTPASPVQIGANGAGSTPASPVQIAGNGGASSPAAPGVVAADITAQSAGLLISGTLSPDVAGYLPQTGVDGATGRPIYDSGAGVVPDTGPFTQVLWDVNAWQLRHYPDGLAGAINNWIATPGTEATPNLATGWAPDASETGTPVFTLVAKAAPGQIAANGTASTPSAPPVIA
jgi:hypothetical protein